MVNSEMLSTHFEHESTNSVTQPCCYEPQALPSCRGHVTSRPLGPVDTFQYAMEVGQWRHNIADFIFKSLISFTSGMNFFHVKEGFCSLVDRVNGLHEQHTVSGDQDPVRQHF